MDAGFYRDDIGHLPKNARGVMFYLPSTQPEVSDFKITSPDDKRPLALQVHTSRKGDPIRLEPIAGFAPHAHYTFQYLPTHERWNYPDQMSVTIDDAIADTAGTYRIELARQPEVRMIAVPGSSACTEPAVALTQPFSYRIPAALAPYREKLEYGTHVRPEAPRKPKNAVPELYGWPYRLTTYYAAIFWSNRRSIDEHYTGADDVV